MSNLTPGLGLFLLLTLCCRAAADDEGKPEDEAEVLERIQVTAERVANLMPAASFPMPATQLRFDPQVDLQSRGIPESQADVTVRGGLFENTAFRLGAVTVFDPQTGHYSVEVPIDPAMLSRPVILTDFDHGLRVFNAAVATVQYGFRPVQQGGEVRAGIGTDALRHASARGAWVHDFGLRSIGAEFSAASSRSDGTVPFGDHDFRRLSAHVHLSGPNAETHALFGYLDKFYGWPGAYTGFASLPETDHAKIGLALIDQRRRTARGVLEVGLFYRWLDDDYDFDRRTAETGARGSFEHATRSFGLGVSARQSWGGVEWHLAGQFSADRLVRSTDLIAGDFNTRSYLNFSVAPQKRWTLRPGLDLTLRAGLRRDSSSRDEDAFLPLAGVALERSEPGRWTRVALEYTRLSQVPGYTALKSLPQGLFGGNAGLGREFANTLSLSVAERRKRWEWRAAAFHRRDEDLVDWTFRRGAPFARQANPVDIDVIGFEGLLARTGPALDLVLAYAWLDKDANYGPAAVDASYYALNFARHRLTLALTWRPVPNVEIRLDNEFRRQEENPLRGSRERALLSALSLNWRPPRLTGLSISAIVDNLTDSDFQDFPGTPAYGRQASLNLGFEW